MSNAQDYRNKAAEFNRLATEATSPRLVNELRQRARSFRSLAENEEWVEANRAAKRGEYHRPRSWQVRARRTT